MITNEDIKREFLAAGFELRNGPELDDCIYEGVRRVLSLVAERAVQPEFKTLIYDEPTVIDNELVIASKPTNKGNSCVGCYFMDKPYSYCEEIIENPNISCCSDKRFDGQDIIWIKAEK